jgi:hypothetical protein
MEMNISEEIGLCKSIKAFGRLQKNEISKSLMIHRIVDLELTVSLSGSFPLFRHIRKGIHKEKLVILTLKEVS